MSNSSLTGYGANRSILFSGEAEKFELWEVKFKAYMRLNKLSKVLETTEAVTEDQNAEVFSSLVQVLDDKSIGLIMRDAPNKGREAMAILKDHYAGANKPRIIALYGELTSLRMKSDESVTDYILRGESAAQKLKSAGETISDSLLVAMMLKGLPDGYQTFSTVISQTTKEDLKFSYFKTIKE